MSEDFLIGKLVLQGFHMAKYDYVRTYISYPFDLYKYQEYCAKYILSPFSVKVRA